MPRQSIHITPEFLRRRWDSQFASKKQWLFGPDPDPTYDRLKGWKLDQFAMFFEPDLVRAYKRVMAEGHPHTIPRDPLESRNPREWMKWSSELGDEIRGRLLDARFRVTGYPLDGYEPVVISSDLLAYMCPIIETSELREINSATETARWFERVRVFDLQPAAKSLGGRRPTYDWPRLAELLESEKPALTSTAALVAYCRKTAAVMPGGKPRKDGPDDKSARAAILKYGLEKYIKPV